MAGRVEGKTAIVTGAGSGMGKAMTERLAAEGARVIATDRTGAEKDVAATLGDAVLPFHCDVAIEIDVIALFDHAREQFGGIDIVCNNAGVGAAKITPMHEYPLDDFDRIQSINVRGAFMVLQHSLRLMLESGGGSIINTASIGGFIATPGSSAYITSKGAVVMMTKQAAAEYGGQGIRVNAVCPGVIDTPMVQGKGPELAARLAPDIPQGRLGEAVEVANVAVFLASDEASYVNGQCWAVDGGRLAK